MHDTVIFLEPGQSRFLIWFEFWPPESNFGIKWDHPLFCRLSTRACLVRARAGILQQGLRKAGWVGLTEGTWGVVFMRAPPRLICCTERRTSASSPRGLGPGRVECVHFPLMEGLRAVLELIRLGWIVFTIWTFVNLPTRNTNSSAVALMNNSY